MTAAASRSGTSSADLAEALPTEAPQAAAAVTTPPLAVAARSALSSKSSSRLPVWAARVVFLLGLLNIASALVRRSPRLLDWSQDYLPPFGAVASVAVVGIGVGCGLLVMARGLRRRKQRAWLATWRYSAQRSPFTYYAVRS